MQEEDLSTEKPLGYSVNTVALFHIPVIKDGNFLERIFKYTLKVRWLCEIMAGVTVTQIIQSINTFTNRIIWEDITSGMNC